MNPSPQPIEIVSFPVEGMTCALLDPILAAAAMALSSVTVASNALRLRRFTPAQMTVDQASTKPVSVPNPA